MSPSPRKKSLHHGVGQVTPRDIVDINKDFVASITIERNENPRDIQQLTTSTPKGPRLSGSCTDNSVEHSRQNMGSDDVPPTPSKSAKKLNLCKNLFPGVENTELAQQIDNEILELRNFFDDHWEEMLYLLHGSKDEPLMNHFLPDYQCGPDSSQFDQKQSQSLLNIRHHDRVGSETQLLSSGCTTPDLPDPANFNLHDSVISKFENNPRQEMFRSLQDWNTWKEESESDNIQQDLTLRIRKLEFEKRRKKKERQRRRQAIDDLREFSPTVKQNIQSFFPNFQEFEEKPVMVQSTRDTYHAEEEEGDMDLNNEIPLLHLSDLTSEVTAPDMSIISEAFSAANASQLHPRECLALDGRTSRSIACDTPDLVTIPTLETTKWPTSTQTTPGRETRSQDTKAFNTSLPLLQSSTHDLLSKDNILEAPQNSHNVIIIKQTGCDHAVEVRKKKIKDKKKKNTKELKDLLSSLDSAASLAERLRKRSENLLQSLNNDFIID